MSLTRSAPSLLLALLLCPAPALAEETADVRCVLDRAQTDLSIWPNRQSSANSDPWLWKNHVRIRKMRPRVLVIDFANDVDMAGVKDRTERMIAALAESSRYHGFENPEAPVFLEYQVLKYVDLRDAQPAEGEARRNSSITPYLDESVRRKNGYGDCDYGAFYSKEFAVRYGFEDPLHPGEFLDLNELINRGVVHELWFYWIHDDRGAPFETIEYKQYYDEDCRPIADRHGWAGNGHCRSMPWSGRSFRITFFNPHRGIGCGMENFCHAMEGMANSGSVAYYKRYFDEFAGFDLNVRYGLPGNSLYALLGGKVRAEYPTATSLRIARDDGVLEVENYIAGGNVHFPPGARGHYDLTSPYQVMTFLENYRQKNGTGGADRLEKFRIEKFQPYRDLCSDCMGPWLVYWRQCVPGLHNRSLDDDGRPMKNWWPFLFY